MKKKIFLGGTCNGSQWRDLIKPRLEMEYFDPVVDDWTEEAQLAEEQAKKDCKYSLYVITPLMKGFYSIAELVEDCHNKQKTTIFCYIDEDQGAKWDTHQLKSLKATASLMEKHGIKTTRTLDELVVLLNSL